MQTEQQIELRITNKEVWRILVVHQSPVYKAFVINGSEELVNRISVYRVGETAGEAVGKMMDSILEHRRDLENRDIIKSSEWGLTC